MSPKRTLKIKRPQQPVRKTLPALREEEHSAFTHGLWHRYDLLRLMQWSAKVLDQHHDNTGKYNYSAVQDAFYALSGLTPNDSPAGAAWKTVQAAPGFDDLRDLMDDQFGQAAAVLQLAQNFEKYMMQPPDEQQAQQEQEQADEQQEQEEQEEQGQSPEDNGQEQDADPGQEKGQEDAQGQEQGQEGDQEQQEGTEAQGEGTGGTQQGQKDAAAGAQSGGQKPGQSGDPAQGQQEKDDVIPADRLAGQGVIKPDAQRANARMAINPQVVEEAREQAQVVSTVYSFLHDPVQQREARARELVELQLLSMKSLTNFLGWMRNVVKGARRRGKAAVGEFTGYKPGAWSSNTHPMEMAEVAKGNPVYLTRLVENQLTNRNYKEDRPMGKGPVIVLRDESDSMDMDAMVIDGRSCTLHQAALSFEVALATVMNKEKRDLVSIAWSAGDTRKYTYGEQGMDEHWGAFIGGGTRIEPALEAALKVSQEYVSGADVLIITDGDLQIDPNSPHREWDQQNVELLQEYREQGGRVWAIVINPKHKDIEHKLAWVDGWVTVQDMRAGEKVADMLERMVADRIPSRGKGRVRV